MSDVHVTLRCPICGRTLRVRRDETDPPKTEFVESPCDRHSAMGFEEATYYDAEGKQILTSDVGAA